MSVLIRSIIVTLPNSFNFYFYRQTDNPFSPLIFFFPLENQKKNLIIIKREMLFQVVNNIFTIILGVGKNLI